MPFGDYNKKHVTMLRFSSTSLFLLCFFALSAQNAGYLNYINKFKDIAIREMDRAGVPASIKLGQGLLESGGGTSTLAIKANNHFGIKCGSRWTGRTHYRKDDDRDEKGRLIKSCFRSYRNAEASYVAHSEFLRENPRYDFLFYLNPRDYRRWAYGLKRAGYATSATYAEKLIRIIETYELNQFDNYSQTDLLAGTVPNPGGAPTGGLTGILLNNDVKMVLAKDGQTPFQIAQMTEVPVRSIIKYNEKILNPEQALKGNERVYLQKKRRSYRAKKKYHYVKEGENMYKISQLYGVRLKRLYKRNRMPLNSQPAVGERIKVRGWKVKPTAVPRLRNEVPPRDEPPKPLLPDEDNDGFIDLEDENGNVLPSPNPPKPDPEPEVTTEPEVPKDTIPAVTGKSYEELENDTTDDTYTDNEENYYDDYSEDPEPETPAEEIYVVQRGDTLYAISRRYGMSVQELKDLNGLTSNLIYKGQSLRVQ